MATSLTAFQKPPRVSMRIAHQRRTAAVRWKTRRKPTRAEEYFTISETLAVSISSGRRQLKNMRTHTRDAIVTLQRTCSQIDQEAKTVLRMCSKHKMLAVCCALYFRSCGGGGLPWSSQGSCGTWTQKHRPVSKSGRSSSIEAQWPVHLGRSSASGMGVHTSNCCCCCCCDVVKGDHVAFCARCRLRKEGIERLFSRGVASPTSGSSSIATLTGEVHTTPCSHIKAI
mmetsp:Transcript_103076/g.188069  ORF Transcript_103076/g.188069 Transcript_103076/m.188069 type:complete len:227 (-) Transcript_103076:131-811(-)